jgi:hypothetical protein
VLYKIPTRDLVKQTSATLPDITGNHEHGFMAGKGIREPSLSLFVNHLIQVAQLNKKPLQRVSLDTEIAFDRIGHAIIFRPSGHLEFHKE